MEKRSGSTIMLTVVAIATLLVAVVGATFAYFSANTKDAGAGKATVTVNTAEAADVFLTEGNSSVSVEVTADKMQQTAGSNEYASKITNEDDSNLTVKLTAGSSVATCNYDLIYTPSTAFTPSAEAAAATLKEYTLSGTSTGGKSFTDVNLAGSEVVTLGSFDIVDTYADALEATVDTWTFTANFYNLAVDQGDNIGQEFGGVVSVTSVACTNAANN